ncbi:hypothetical protein IGB42_02650 [Andreprevotia sp. IGB-42]|uniref:hypothetical protein n=1 Tax=Andreprevotia sp. IGB-42 TaxID=2497473 RepID=UPI0013572A06|nr:hypothetical protein [Andreprevotia sp. IGB-42]KAF0812807.1 hypothetical protein IGB42_02650 [Andreprevotia sp. IGB-42]
MDFDWKKTVGAIAPVIGTALAGGNPLAGVAISAVLKSFGLDAGTDTSTLASAIQGATPEQLIALKNADLQFQRDMAELGFRNQEAIANLQVRADEVDAGDRASARAREVAMGDRRVFWLTCLIVVAVLSLEGLALFYGIPKTAIPELVGRILGTLDAMAMAAIFYTYGTSRGSQQKTQLLSQADAVK